jgi:hypothetical protein
MRASLSVGSGTPVKWHAYLLLSGCFPERCDYAPCLSGYPVTTSGCDTSFSLDGCLIR